MCSTVYTASFLAPSSVSSMVPLWGSMAWVCTVMFGFKTESCPWGEACASPLPLFFKNLKG